MKKSNISILALNLECYVIQWGYLQKTLNILKI